MNKYTLDELCTLPPPLKWMNYADAMIMQEQMKLQEELWWKYGYNTNYKNFLNMPPMQTILVLCGIPCSGKSTFAVDFYFKYVTTKIVSRDMIRLEFFGPKYKQNKINESHVTTIFNIRLNAYLSQGYNVILDNCHCKESYITELEKVFEHYSYVEVKVKYFDISLTKAIYRNIIRYIKTGKWIPIKVIRNMKKNYDKINRENHKTFNNLQS